MLPKSCLTLLMLGLLGQGAAAEPFHHPFGEWREYNRDWLAACPDAINEEAANYQGYSCYASTYSQQLNSASLPAYSVTVIRNRLTGELDIAFTLADDSVETDIARPLVLQFPDDPPLQLDFAADLETRSNVSNQYFLVDPSRKAALLDSFKQRNVVELTVPLAGTGQSLTTRLSLRGLNASLDFMDAYARKVAHY